MRIGYDKARELLKEQADKNEKAEAERLAKAGKSETEKVDPEKVVERTVKTSRKVTK